MPKLGRGFQLTAIFVLLVILLIGANAIGNPSCSSRLRHDKQIQINGKNVFLQTVVSAADQEKGLGGLNCIGRNEGMLFVFDSPGYYRFWMKDMRFSLDMVWLSSDKQVVTELKAISPSTYPEAFTSQSPAQYVLELNAGQADKLNLSQGQFIKF